jgi:hypothetical protein
MERSAAMSRSADRGDRPSTLLVRRSTPKASYSPVPSIGTTNETAEQNVGEPSADAFHAPETQAQRPFRSEQWQGQPGHASQVKEKPAMSVSVLDMSMSLDGYIADLDDFLGGDDGERLHKWADADGESGQASGPAAQFQDEWTAAGAVLAGRRTAELMDHWGGTSGGLPISCRVTGRPARPPVGAIRW